MFIKNSSWLTSLTTLTLSAALHALLLVVLFTNFPALGDEPPKKPDEPRLVVIATILPEKKIEIPEPPKPIPSKNKSPEPKKQKTPTPSPTKARTPSDALRVLPPSPSAPPPSEREAKTAHSHAQSLAPLPEGGQPRSGRGESDGRAGGSSIASLANVKIISRVKPQYPQIARKRNEEGTVVLLARVQGGRVASLSVEKSSGVKTLDASARSAVEKWKFSPDTNATVRVPVSFSLKE